MFFHKWAFWRKKNENACVLVILWRQKEILINQIWSHFCTYILACLRSNIKFFRPMIYFLLTKSRSIESHMTAKKLDQVCYLTLYCLSLITVFAYLSWYVSLKKSAAFLTGTIYEAIFHKKKMENLHGHMYEDSFEINSTVSRDFQSLSTDLDWITGSFRGSSRKSDKRIWEQKGDVSCMA